MVGVFLFGTFYRKQPIGIALLIGATVGGLIGNMLPNVFGGGFSPRHLVEGAFTYFDPMLIIFTAILFMKVIEKNGSLGLLARLIIERFGKQPVLLLVVVTLFIMFPAMLTGITTTSVLTTGALIAAPLMALGLPRVTAGAMIALVSIMGMIAPPINILAMLIGQGVDMPYIGFTGPLAFIAFPLALIIAFSLAYSYLKKADAQAALDQLPNAIEGKSLGIQFLPLVVVFAFMAAIRMLPSIVPDIGVPLIFLIGAVIGLFTGRKVVLFETAYNAVLTALPVLGLLAGIGMFLQVMTLTGVRGLIVVGVLSLPVAWKYLGILISLPAFGGVSAFASAMVFGIPFLLSLLGRNEIVVCAGIALLAGLGDVLLPSAIEARFAAQVVDEPKFTKIVWKWLPFVLLCGLVGLAVIYWADALTFLVP